jgi:DNA-binding NarL/FixJ family response regulator
MTALAVRRNAEARRQLRASLEALQRDREAREVRTAPHPTVEVALLRDATQRLARLVEGLEGSPPAAAPAAGPMLTRRQLEVLGLLAEGLGTAEIARRLWLSRCTVRNHVTAILTALGAHSRLEAVARARALQLL